MTHIDATGMWSEPYSRLDFTWVVLLEIQVKDTKIRNPKKVRMEVDKRRVSRDTDRFYLT